MNKTSFKELKVNT